MPVLHGDHIRPQTHGYHRLGHRIAGCCCGCSIYPIFTLTFSTRNCSCFRNTAGGEGGYTIFVHSRCYMQFGLFHISTSTDTIDFCYPFYVLQSNLDSSRRVRCVLFYNSSCYQYACHSFKGIQTQRYDTNVVKPSSMLFDALLYACGLRARS